MQVSYGCRSCGSGCHVYQCHVCGVMWGFRYHAVWVMHASYVSFVVSCGGHVCVMCGGHCVLWGIMCGESLWGVIYGETLWGVIWGCRVWSHACLGYHGYGASYVCEVACMLLCTCVIGHSGWCMHVYVCRGAMCRVVCVCYRRHTGSFLASTVTRNTR